MRSTSPTCWPPGRAAICRRSRRQPRRGGGGRDRGADDRDRGGGGRDAGEDGRDRGGGGRGRGGGNRAGALRSGRAGRPARTARRRARERARRPRYRPRPLRLSARRARRLHVDDAAPLRRAQGTCRSSGSWSACGTTRSTPRTARTARPPRACSTRSGASCSSRAILDAAQRQRLLEIADKCPVHRTLTSEVKIRTHLAE